MDEVQYKKRIAQLETVNDQLVAEFNNLDVLLKKLGFEEGIATLKDAAKEMLERKGPETKLDPQSEEHHDS